MHTTLRLCYVTRHCQGDPLASAVGESWKKLHQIGQTQFVDLNEIMRKLCLIDKYRSCHDQEWMKRVRNQICL